MSDNKMWFGPRGHEMWVKCPAVNSENELVGWEEELQYLNGGAALISSKTAHRKVNFSWSLASRKTIREVTDVALGMRGQGLIYWGDPFTMDVNVMPQYWSAPYLMAHDAPLLGGMLQRPVLAPTPANLLGYPPESAVIIAGDLSGITNAFEMYVPIPPGYTAHFGAHGTGQPIFGVAAATGESAYGALTYPAILPVTSETRFNATVDSTAGTGMVIVVDNTSGVSATIAGIMVQVLPTGQVPETGGFISGQGHAGCRMGMPNVSHYSAALDLVGAVINLTEVGPWEQVPIVLTP